MEDYKENIKEVEREDPKGKLRASIMYAILGCVVMFLSLVVLVNICLFKLVYKDKWLAEKRKYVIENDTIYPTRGNILSMDNKLLASSLPEYRLYIDFVAGDTLISKHRREISKSLSSVLKKRSQKWFEERLAKGGRDRSRYFSMYPYNISFIDKKRILEKPYLCLSKNKTGLIFKEYRKRKAIFGDLANQTLGRVYGETGRGRSGLEIAYDSLLRGEKGLAYKRKALNSYVRFEKIPVENGCDLVTTLDMQMQDICNNALREQLAKMGGEIGIVVLMEVKTGDIKAIVNLRKGSDGIYRETQSSAISDLLEPGSTFKTASIMLAMDDGYITPSTTVNTGNGLKIMHGAKMKDWNYSRGGFGVLDVSEIMMNSSNIGVSELIDKYYKDQPAKYIEGLKRMGLGEKLNIQLQGEGTPVLHMPRSKTDLPWMSIGYSLQFTPLQILTFYNAIANDGKMMKPRFVIEVRKNEKVVETFPEEVIRKRICKKETLRNMQNMLRKVVAGTKEKDGTGRRAGNPNFPVSGKTGTAQMIQGKGYKGGNVMKYYLSFCGYFPSDDPQYSCIVGIQRYGTGGGSTVAAPVFSKISQKVIARKKYNTLKQAKDTVNVLTPYVMSGNYNATCKVLDELDIDYKNLQKIDKNYPWVSAAPSKKNVEFTPMKQHKNLVPNVHGMGAMDAVYLLESSGLRVKIKGKGKVSWQSIGPGNQVVKGQTIELTLR